MTAPDVGTSSSDMDVIGENGGKYILGQSAERGGFGNSGPITGFGVYVSMKVACQKVFGSPSLKGRKVLVQGAGQVGSSVIKHLVNEGADVLVNELNDYLAQKVSTEFKVGLVPTKDVYTTECDIFSPCGLGGILNAETIPQLRCKIIAGGANNQLSDREKATELQRRAILYLPDYVINCGGSIGLIGHDLMGMSHEQVEKRTAERIPEVLEQILNIAKSKNISTEDAALTFVRETLG